MSELSSLCVQMSVRLFVEVLYMLHVSGACLACQFILQMVQCGDHQAQERINRFMHACCFNVLCEFALFCAFVRCGLRLCAILGFGLVLCPVVHHGETCQI